MDLSGRSLCADVLAQSAIPPWRDRSPSAREVMNGIDVLVLQKVCGVAGKRVGLITNHTGSPVTATEH